MDNVLKNSVSKIRLIGKIKGLAAESKHTRQLILGTSLEEKKYKYANNKYIIGLDIRHHLLAYAFMRGTPYAMLEKKHRPGHAPNANDIFTIVAAHIPTWYREKGGWTLGNLYRWLSGEAQ